MQRIMVDLPEPDGPQMTMRSRRITLRLMFAQHVEIPEPFVHVDDLDRHFVGGGCRLGVGRGVVRRL